MLYFDTDVIVHAIIIQDQEKHKKAIRLIEKAIDNKSFFTSLLVLQEITFVLSKLKKEANLIRNNINKLIAFSPINYTLIDFKRAMTIAIRGGYRNINDCLHIAIAENYCSELITFNKDDYKKLRSYTDLKIKIL